MASMPPRKRKKVAEADRDPVVRFGEAVLKSDAQAAAERARVKAERAEAARLAQLAAEHAEAVRLAGIELERAIAAAKAARASGRGIADADAAWKRAKARVIELETGAAPAWERTPPAS